MPGLYQETDILVQNGYQFQEQSSAKTGRNQLQIQPAGCWKWLKEGGQCPQLRSFPFKELISCSFFFLCPRDFCLLSWFKPIDDMVNILIVTEVVLTKFSTTCQVWSVI